MSHYTDRPGAQAVATTTRYPSGDNRGGIPLNHETAPPWAMGEGNGWEGNRKGAPKTQTTKKRTEKREKARTDEEATRTKTETPTGQRQPAKREGDKGQGASQMESHPSNQHEGIENTNGGAWRPLSQ